MRTTMNVDRMRKANWRRQLDANPPEVLYPWSDPNSDPLGDMMRAWKRGLVPTPSVVRYVEGLTSDLMFEPIKDKPTPSS
jgi:hypothetical protein